MSRRNRTAAAAAVIAAVALSAIAGVALAAVGPINLKQVPSLSPTPPVPLPAHASPSPGPARRHAAHASSAPLPNTGMNLTWELVAASLLGLGGAGMRVAVRRRPVRPARPRPS